MFICKLLDPLNGENQIFEAKAKKLQGMWLAMFKDLFINGRAPLMVVQPAVAGIYILERII